MKKQDFLNEISKMAKELGQHPEKMPSYQKLNDSNWHQLQKVYYKMKELHDIMKK